MITRDISGILKEMALKMPIISIIGPRQSGKTTLAKACFPDYKYVNLESPETRMRAIGDPKIFLQDFEKGLIIDEAQKAPELFSYIQVLSDESGKVGEYVLSGSQNFLLSKNISQSLAGRVFISHLLPFSMKELKQGDLLEKNLDSQLFRGFYPRLYDKDIEPRLFYPSYNQTYLERDVPDMLNIRNLNTFRKFMGLLAGRMGQLINFSSLGIELGLDYKTMQSWCSVLEASFVIYFLRPYHRNLSKRIVKSPKVYFYDTGLACNLLGIQSEKELVNHWIKGPLFENMIISDCAKDYFNRGKKPPIYFWRDNKGLEIDMLLAEDSQLKTIEIKSGTTVHPEFFRNLEKFKSLLPEEKVKGYLVYGGEDKYKYKDFQVLPWKHWMDT